MLPNKVCRLLVIVFILIHWVVYPKVTEVCIQFLYYLFPKMLPLQTWKIAKSKHRLILITLESGRKVGIELKKLEAGNIFTTHSFILLDDQEILQLPLDEMFSGQLEKFPLFNFLPNTDLDIINLDFILDIQTKPDRIFRLGTEEQCDELGNVIQYLHINTYHFYYDDWMIDESIKLTRWEVWELWQYLMEAYHVSLTNCNVSNICKHLLLE